MCVDGSRRMIEMSLDRMQYIPFSLSFQGGAGSMFAIGDLAPQIRRVLNTHPHKLLYLGQARRKLINESRVHGYIGMHTHT